MNPLFPDPSKTRNADDMGLPTPTRAGQTAGHTDHWGYHASGPNPTPVLKKNGIYFAVLCHEGERPISIYAAKEITDGLNNYAALVEQLADSDQRALSAEFWRDHAKQTNAEFEADYLAIWKLVKHPDKTVLESVVALQARVEGLEKALRDLYEAAKLAHFAIGPVVSSPNQPQINGAKALLPTALAAAQSALAKTT